MCQQALDFHILIISTRIDCFSSFSQTHPNVDKKLFTAESVIGLKNPEKSFPLNNDVGVLKWRLQTTDESLIPLTSKWPCFTVLSSVRYDDAGLFQYSAMCKCFPTGQLTILAQNTVKSIYVAPFESSLLDFGLFHADTLLT